MSTAVAVVLFVGIMAYAVFGGADFGAGFWDLTAGGTERGHRPRTVIDHSIGPVWEANHVWLIFVLVVLWTGFSEVYSAIWLTMFVPLTLAALGIVLRGSSFAFRHAVFRTRDQRRFGAVFAVSSLVVPFCLGAVAGGIASGRVPTDGEAGDPVNSWLNPTSIVSGVLAVTVVAFLAAVYLVWDADRLGDRELVEYFRRRAVGAAVAVALVMAGGILVVRGDSRSFYDGLTSAGLPALAVSVVAGVGALLLLVRDQHRGARLLAVLAVAALVLSWGLAQWDDMLPDDLTVAEAAAPSATLTTLLVVTGVAVVLLGPAFALLYVLDQRGLLPEESVADSDAGPA